MVATETSLSLGAFPPPADLWGRYGAWKGLTEEAEQIVLQDYFDDGSGKGPRYYQVNAINAAIEAIAKGRDRILLVMATGTGKTYTAFQTFGGCGRRAGKSESCSWLIAMSSSIRRW
jgi:type I restriction enzyme R subunit